MTDKEIIQAFECCSKSDAMLCYGCPQAEIERLKNNNKAIMQTIADVRTEAIKEFAERLKESNHGTLSYCTGWVDFDDIDNIVKEMVGEQG